MFFEGESAFLRCEFTKFSPAALLSPPKGSKMVFRARRRRKKIGGSGGLQLFPPCFSHLCNKGGITEGYELISDIMLDGKISKDEFVTAMNAIGSMLPVSHS